MSVNRIDSSVLRDPSWWHWLATIPLLTLHLAGISGAFNAAAGLCAVATGFFLSRTRSVQAYPVQIRVAYLLWMLGGLLPGMSWMHWVQLAGTSAMVTVGYCPLARMLSLMPFNRTDPLRWSSLVHAFWHDPCAGGLIRLSEIPVVPAACSLQRPSI